METFDFAPMTPSMGPPLPRGLMTKWPWLKTPGNPGSPPAVYDAEIEEMTTRKQEESSFTNSEKAQQSSKQDNYVIVLRKRNTHPIWLKEHQEKLKQASRIASEKTNHLRGSTRVQTMNRIIGEILKDGRPRTKGS